MPTEAVEVKLAIPFVGEVGATWSPDRSEQLAAWELYVELVTRVSVMPLGGSGLLQESLSSLHALFEEFRKVLRQYGPALAPSGRQRGASVGYISVAVLNGWLRPLLTYWHPRLQAYEAGRPESVSLLEHENAWLENSALRTEIEKVRLGLLGFARELEKIANVSSLLPNLEGRAG